MSNKKRGIPTNEDNSSDDISETEIKKQKVELNKSKNKKKIDLEPTLTFEKLLKFDKPWKFGNFVEDLAYEQLFDSEKELKAFLVKQREFEKRKSDVLLSVRSLFPKETTMEYYVWKDEIYDAQKTWVEIKDNRLKRKINDLAFSIFE
jgi:hypothetical protein